MTSNNELHIELEYFLNKFYSSWGFFTKISVEELTQNHVSILADQFARQVLEKEGLNPDMELESYRSIKKTFTNRYGNELILRPMQQ